MGSIVIFAISIIFSLICYGFIWNIYINKNESGYSKTITIGELLFWNCTLCLFENITVSFVMALVGCYSLLHLAICILVKNVILSFYIFKKKGYLKRIGIDRKINICVLLIIIVCIILYFEFPTEYLWGRRDPFLYVMKGVTIAKTGAVLPQTSEYLNTYYNEIKDFVDLTYRGVYSDFLQGNSVNPGDIQFQFLDYFPSLLAIGYSIAGLDGLFHIHMIVAILCLLAVYYFTKHFFEKRVATIAVFFLAVCPAQLWSARITQTELLYQLCWIVSIYLFGIAWKENKKGLMTLTGCVMGFIGLNRIDAYIIGLGVYAVVIYCNLFFKSRSRLIGRLGCSYTISACISLLYSVIYSFYYVEDHWNAKVLKLLVIANLGLGIVALITYIFRDWKIFSVEQYNFMAFICDKKKYRIMVCWILFWFCRWLYYGRPLNQKGESYDWDFWQRAFPEFCWYTTSVMILFAIYGLYIVMKEKNKRKELLLFLASGFSMLIIYLWQPSVAPDHLWASRRWVSVCIPFVFIIGASGLVKFADAYIKNNKRIILTILSVAISIPLILKDQLFIFTPMLNELQTQYENLVDNMDSDKVYFAQMSHYGAALRFIYGKETYVLKNNSADAINAYIQQTGKEVYFIGDISVLGESVRYEKLFDGKIEGTYVNQTINAYPVDLTKTGAITNIYRIY